MDASPLKKMKYLIKKWLSDKYPVVNHKEIIKDIYGEADISIGYLLVLTLANLIALCGLLINSVPVIIGAMLISPLMGPFLSFGFSFITGDSFLWAKSSRKIIVGVFLTILIAAAASYLSPLNEVTPEIAARTKPNVFDLLIAFLAGTTGASAICTKKNYLTIVPGVAIATAVIPPLSVTGFGLGNWNLTIAAGAFFLFFTNFVAIVLSTCLIVYLYGFRPRMTGEQDVKKLQRRLVFLSTVLLAISIPLIYTLYQGVAEIKLKKDIEASLKQQFNREQSIHLSTYRFHKPADGMLEIHAVVNTVKYMKDSDLQLAKQKVENNLQQKVRLYVDQIKVQPGGLVPQEVKFASVIAPPKSTVEMVDEARKNIIPVVRQACGKADEIFVTAKITDFSITFTDKDAMLFLLLKVRRDHKFSGEELAWLERFFSASLNIPVKVSVETEPFVPVLFFDPKSVTLTEEMKKNLASLKDVVGENERIMIFLEIVAESRVPYRERIRLAAERAGVITDFLQQQYNVAPSQIRRAIAGKAAERPSVRIRLDVMPGEK
ncbi:MAG: TIGR00341 family protein [Smithellaceae bacterium]